MDWQISSEEVLRVARALIRVRSVREAPQPDAPFGLSVRKAFDAFFAEATRLGLTRQHDDSGYAAEVEIGQGDEIVGVLVHLDVVAEGDGWTVPPYAGTVQGGRLFGRGATDDKGPAAAALIALAAVAAQGPKLRRRVRLIAGGDEESYWQCMEHYLQHRERPQVGFTPDGDFPLVHGEKGGLSLRLERPAQVPQRYAIEAGQQPNVVPDHARIELAQPMSPDAVLETAKELGVQVVPDLDEPKRVFDVVGEAAHASQPEQGVNAIREAHRLFGRNLHDPLLDLLIADDYGEALGIASQDDRLGRLTANLGVIRHDATGTKAWIDIRYPLAIEADEIVERLRRKLAPFGVAVTVEFQAAPHWVPPDDSLVTTLLGVYRRHTDDPTPPLVIGGLTYARTLGHAVAFGPLFPGRKDVAHQADESVSVADLELAARIYADAILALAT